MEMAIDKMREEHEQRIKRLQEIKIKKHMTNMNAASQPHWGFLKSLQR